MLKNAAWYFEPDYREGNDFMGRLWVLPYDYDVSWGPTWAHGSRPASASRQSARS